MGATVRPAVRAGFVMFVFGAVLALPGSAEAGGSPFWPDRDHYAVGDPVSLSGDVCETGQLSGTMVTVRTSCICCVGGGTGRDRHRLRRSRWPRSRSREPADVTFAPTRYSRSRTSNRDSGN